MSKIILEELMFVYRQRNTGEQASEKITILSQDLFRESTAIKSP
jgi:hypothetical protein